MSIWSFALNNVLGFFDGRKERADMLKAGVADQWSTLDMPIPDENSSASHKRRVRGRNKTFESAQHAGAIFSIIVQPGRTIGRAGGVGAALHQTGQHMIGYYEVFKAERRISAAALAAHADGALTPSERDAILAVLPDDASTDMRGFLAAQLENPPTLRALLKQVPRNDVAFKHEIFDVSASVIGPDPSEAETAYLNDLWAGLKLVCRQEAAREVSRTQERRSRCAI